MTKMTEYDVLEDEREEERYSDEYIAAWAQLLDSPQGQTVATGLLRRGGLGLPVISESDRILHNQAISLFHDLFVANETQALLVFVRAVTPGV